MKITAETKVPKMALKNNKNCRICEHNNCNICNVFDKPIFIECSVYKVGGKYDKRYITDSSECPYSKEVTE